jgi:hypothetical protein
MIHETEYVYCWRIELAVGPGWLDALELTGAFHDRRTPRSDTHFFAQGRYRMLLLILLVLLVLAVGGGIIVSKFLFLLLLVAIAVAVFSRLGSRSTT